MSNISSTCADGLLTVLLQGRIDSTNTSSIEAELDSIRESYQHSAVTLDLDGLEYISSAGLRMILRLRKSEPQLNILNASSEVYDVFEMTGFTEMIPVSKAYRRISIDGCEVIGKGANGKVYRIDADTIVKVYNNPNALPDIKRERELARRAFVLGIPTAIPYDVVRVGDGYGSVFELLNAKSFSQLIAEEPERLDEYVKLYVDLLKKLHSTVVQPDELPDMRDTVIKWAEFLREYLPADKAEKLVSLVKAVPVDYHMVHGDYHIKNVMIQNGEVLLIDMDTLCHGKPIFELASVYNSYLGFSELDNSVSQSFLGVSHEIAESIWRKFLPLYLETDNAEIIGDVEQKAMLIGYTRLMRRLIRRHENETEQGRRNIEVYRNHIIELLDKVDTLEF